MKAFAVIVILRLLAVVVILVLLRGLQIRFGIGIAMLGLLHVAAITALVTYFVQHRIRGEQQDLSDRTKRRTV